MRRNQEQAHVITSVQRGISEEQKGRRDRYIIGMSIRTICFVGAIMSSGPLQWVLLGGAIFLPYIAVFIANAGREWDKTPFLMQPFRNRREINSESKGY